MVNNELFTKVFNERIESLIKDRYCKRIDTRLPNLWFVRLKHMSNGNTIVLKAYPQDSVIHQYTNGICKHTEYV